MGVPALRSTIFSDLNANNFQNNEEDPRSMRRGLYVHLGNISPHVYKAILEAKYGITTEYVDELQQKWQHYKAEDVKYHFTPRPSSPDGTGTGSKAPFDPLLPEPNVWNEFYLDSRDAIMSEIFTECLTDRSAFLCFMDVIEPFWQARIDNVELPNGYPTVTDNLARLAGNDEVAHNPQVFDYIALLLQRTAPIQRVDGRPMTPEEEAAVDIIVNGQMGEDGLTYARRYKYVGRVFVTWLEVMIETGKPSPSSGDKHLKVAQGLLKTLQDFPTYAPAETFPQRFEEYQHVISAFADWMRIKLSREDYLLRIKYAHVVILSLPDSVDTKITMPAVWQEDEYAHILCAFWARLGFKPEPWMRLFHMSEEEIRQLVRHGVVTASDQIHTASGRLAIRDDLGTRISGIQETAVDTSHDPPKDGQAFFPVITDPNPPVEYQRQTYPDPPVWPQHQLHPDPQVRISTTNEPPVKTVNPLHLMKVADILPPDSEQPERRKRSETQRTSGKRGRTAKQATGKGNVSGPPGRQEVEATPEVIEDCKDTVVILSDDEIEITSSQRVASTKTHGRGSLPKQLPREKRPALEPLQQAPASKRTPRSPAKRVAGSMELRARSSKRPFSPLPILEDDDAEFEKEMQDLLAAEDKADSEFVP